MERILLIPFSNLVSRLLSSLAFIVLKASPIICLQFKICSPRMLNYFQFTNTYEKCLRSFHKVFGIFQFFSNGPFLVLILEIVLIQLACCDSAGYWFAHAVWQLLAGKTEIIYICNAIMAKRVSLLSRLDYIQFPFCWTFAVPTIV